MKNTVLSLLVALLAISSKAQITIDSADFASIGVVIYTAQDTQVTGLSIPAGSSTPQSWDYSGLTQHVLDSAQFLDPAGTPGASEFPGADMALFQDGQYAYLRKTDTYLDIVGLYGDILGQGIVLPIKPSPAQRNVVFPSTYGTSFTTNSVIDSTIEDIYTGIFDSLRLRRISNIVSEVDAFGSLTTPSATYADVLRQEVVTTNIDTVWGYNQFLGSWNMVTELVTTEYAYRFIAEDKDFFILELQADNNGQVFSARYQVGGKPAASGTVTDLACAGGADGSIVQSVLGGTPPYTYQWNNGATTKDVSGLVSGSYTVTIYDQLDSAIVNYMVNEPAPITAAETVTDELFGNDGAIALTVSGGVTSYTFQWSTGATTKDVSGLVSGSYTVTITDANSCDTSFTYAVGSNTSVDAVDRDERMRVFPNPVTDYVEVRTTSANLKVQIFSLSGKRVLFKNALSNTLTISLEDLPAGIYLLEAQSDAGVYREKLVIGH